MTEAQVTYATVRREYAADLEPSERRHFVVVPDATRWNKIGIVRTALCALWIIVRLRPHVVITTGAAPGFFAVLFGRMLGSRTVWLDSIANAEELSLSGLKAGRWATLWLTQWPHLARAGGPEYRGSVL